MDAIIAKIAEEWPLLAFFLLVIVLDMRREAERVKNAKELRAQDQAHQRELANMQANNIKTMVDTINQSHREITQALAHHENESQERYERMTITQDLIDAIKEKATATPRKQNRNS